MSPLDIARALPGLVWIAVVGRTVLAWLPAGRPGSHVPRDLPGTAATAFALGVGAVAIQGRVLALLGVGECPWLWITPWPLAIVARLPFQPGAMVPRHDPVERRPERWERVLGRVFALASLALFVTYLARLEVGGGAWHTPSRLAGRIASTLTGSDPGFAEALVHPFAVLAAVVLLAEGLRLGGRGPALRRGLATLALASPLLAALATNPPGAAPALALVAATLVHGMAWLRRAEVRGKAIATVCLAALPCWYGGAWPVALVLAGAWCVSAPGPMRVATGKASAAALLLGSLGVAADGGGVSWSAPRFLGTASVGAAWLPYLALAAFGLTVGWLVHLRPGSPRAAFDGRRETTFVALFVTALLAFGGVLVEPEGLAAAGVPLERWLAPAVVAPGIVLLVGRALALPGAERRLG